MEKNIHSKDTHTNSLKNLLAVGALSFVLLWNSDNILAQTEQTKQDLAKNINKTEDGIKRSFVANVAPVINTIDHISDMPLKIKYKNSDFALKYNFPDSIDIFPKSIKWGAKSLVTLIIDDKKYNITPYKGIKIKNMKIVPNKNLDDTKVILTVEVIWFFPWDIEISCRKMSEYLYDLSKLDVWQKISLWWIHVQVLKNKQISQPQKTLGKQMTDTNIVKVSSN